MAESQHRVLVVGEFIARGLKNFANQVRGFNQVIGMSHDQFKQLNTTGLRFDERQKHLTTTGAKYGNRLRMMTAGLRGFKMEMLGVMFFGMMLNRTFMGLLKTSMDWLGINEILTMTLGILFLPIAELILTWALFFLEAVSGLSEETKLMIGAFVLAGAIFGGFLFIVGSVVLGIGALIVAWGFLALPIMIVVGALALFIAVVAGGAIFDTLNSKIGGTETALNGLDFGMIKEKLVAGLGKAIDFITENLPIWTEKGLELAAHLLKGIADKSDEIGEALQNIIVGVGKWLEDNYDELVKLGVSIAKAVIKGFTDAYMNFFANIGSQAKANLQQSSKNARQMGITTTPGFTSVNDFILQPNGRLIKTNPQDTIMGTKNGMPGGNMNFEVTYNVTVSDKREFERMLNDNNYKLTQDLRRLIKV